MSAIVVDRISKSYHYSAVLRETSFTVDKGQCYVLFGANGAGKTTLLRILATIQRPTGGRFLIHGQDGVAQRHEVRDNIFLITHGSHLYDELSGAENLRFSLTLRGIDLNDDARNSVLERVGLGKFADLKTRFYSSGMKKRLAFAKAMIIRPQVLMLDEPYAGLDEKAMDMINGFVRELVGEERTVLMVSHNRHKAAEVAQRVGVLRRGGVEEISVAELVACDELF